MPPNETYTQKILHQQAEENPSYFMCGRKSLPQLIKKAKQEADKILAEFSAFFDTNGKLGIEIAPIDHGGITYSIAATLTWDGEPMQKQDDPCDLLFLQLNNLMLNRMIQLGIPSGGGAGG